MNDQPADGSLRTTDGGIPHSRSDTTTWLEELLESSFRLELTPSSQGGFSPSEFCSSLSYSQAINNDPTIEEDVTVYLASSNPSRITLQSTLSAASIVQARSDTDTLRPSSCSIVGNDDDTIVGASSLVASSVRTIKSCGGRKKGETSVKWWRKFFFVPWSSSRRKTAPTIDLTSNPAFSPTVGPPILYGSYQVCLAAIGGGGIGKSYIFERFLTGRISSDGQYDPTIIDTVTTYRELATNSKSQVHGVTLHLTDVSGQTEYEALRAMDCYPLQHLVMICFSIDSYRSLEFAKYQCFEEFNFYNYNNIPYILVGCQSDKRGGHEEVSKMEAEWTALEIGAVAYLECSAKTGQGIEELFQKSCEIALNWAWDDSNVRSVPRQDSLRDHKKEEIIPVMNCVMM